MEKILLSVVVFFAFVQGISAASCLQYGVYSDTYLYCSETCCGSYYSRYCCSYSYTDNTDNTDYSSSYSYTWSTAAIAGAVIGGIIGLSILVAIIIAVIKACSKTGTHGRVVQPVNPNNGAFVVNTSTQSYPSTTQYGMAPPTGMAPPPGVVYPPQSGQQPVGPGTVG